LQIERRAYYRIDKIAEKEGDLEINLILVPDGKKVGLASIKTATDKEGDIQKKDLAQKVEEKKSKGVSKKEKKKEKEVKQEVKQEVTSEEVKPEEAKTEETKPETKVEVAEVKPEA
jgi:hypothetical protein